MAVCDSGLVHVGTGYRNQRHGIGERRGCPSQWCLLRRQGWNGVVAVSAPHSFCPGIPPATCELTHSWDVRWRKYHKAMCLLFLRRFPGAVTGHFSFHPSGPTFSCVAMTVCKVTGNAGALPHQRREEWMLVRRWQSLPYFSFPNNILFDL